MEPICELNRFVRFGGYRDLENRYVPFSMADDVFSRARATGARVLLRLELDDQQKLNGVFYSNQASLCAN